MTTATIAVRSLDVAVVHNIRSLAGLRLDGARRTGCTDLIRAASLGRLTEAGAGTLADAGVRTIVDLRSAEERGREPTTDLSGFGISVINAPVFESDQSPVGQAADQFPGFVPVYQRMLTAGSEAFRRVAEVVANESGGVLFHCSAGKDRTGLAAALLLGAAGVDDDDIVADYAQSEAGLAPVMTDWISRMEERGVPIERARGLLTSLPSDMQSTLDFIRTTWGSAEGYLLDAGLTHENLRSVKARITA
jgi:protein-tyrosine phosphatase